MTLIMGPKHRKKRMNGQRSKEVFFLSLKKKKSCTPTFKIIISSEKLKISSTATGKIPCLFFSFSFLPIAAMQPQLLDIIMTNTDQYMDHATLQRFIFVFKQKHNVHSIFRKKQMAITTMLLTETIWFMLTHTVSNKQT